MEIKPANNNVFADVSVKTALSYSYQVQLKHSSTGVFLKSTSSVEFQV